MTTTYVRTVTDVLADLSEEELAAMAERLAERIRFAETELAQIKEALTRAVLDAGQEPA